MKNLSGITHKHHLVPRHMGGTDDPSNLVELTLYEHINIHKKLWETNGRWQDKVAWKCLSGQMTMDEASRIAQHNGRVTGGKATRGYGNYALAKNPNHQKEAHAALMSKNPNHQREAAVAANAPTETCEHCGKVLGKANYSRHHGDKCKFKEG